MYIIPIIWNGIEVGFSMDDGGNSPQFSHYFLRSGFYYGVFILPKFRLNKISIFGMCKTPPSGRHVVINDVGLHQK